MQYRSVTVLAPAKLNLSLDVVGTLPNGYHDLDMVMQTIDLYEKITLRRSNDLSLTLPGSFVPVNDKNTAVKAALAFFDYTGLLAGVDMTIYKRVPVRAGMAGGSADAAAVLVGLNELYGARLSAAELCALGAPAPSDPNAQYRTRCFLEFTVRGVDVDVMAGFVILENGQEHDCALKPEQVAEHILVRGEDIPLQSLEDWRRYYAWMGRTSKVAMIDGKTMR